MGQRGTHLTALPQPSFLVETISLFSHLLQVQS
jgi:hypothetical protein